MPLATFTASLENQSKTLHIDISRDDDQVVVASTAVFRILDIDENQFRERINLRGSKAQNLNYSCNDVVWNKHDPNILATAATNGAVVLWNLGRSSRAKQEHVFNDHQRTVNKVAFHPLEANYLVSGSQDGTMKLFDTRTHETATVFSTGSYISVRDVAFCPHGNGHTFAAALENGMIQIWDVRRPDRMERQIQAHSANISCIDWHPESRFTLASGGRDKQIKIWNTIDQKCEHFICTTGPVCKIRWRPRHNYHIASCSGFVGEFSVNIWDVRRSFIPFAVFYEHRNITTDIKWLQDPERILSGGKDTLIHNAFGDCQKPAAKAPPTGLAMNLRGKISLAFRDGTSSVGSQPSTLTSFPETVPRFSNITPTDSASFRMSSFLRPQIQPPSEKDLFLIFNSQLKEFLNSRPEDSTLLTNEDFIICGQKYMLSGASIDVLCDHNAQVADAAKRHQTAEAWRILKLLVKDPRDFTNEDEDEQDVKTNRKRLNDNVTERTSEASENRVVEDTRGTRSRAATESINGARSKRRGSSATSERKFTSSRGKESSAESNRMDQNNSDDEMEGEDADYAENELTLTNIASGQMLSTAGDIYNDFFGDAEIGTVDIQLEHFVTPEVSREQVLELRSEAFEPRINLNVELPEDDAEDNHNNVAEDLDSNGQQGENANNPDDNNAGHTFIVEDQTSAMNIIPSAIEQPSFAPSKIIRDTLVFFAEHGDVQTAVSMYMVFRLSTDFKFLVEENILETWFTCYIELLQRFKLYNVATNLIKKSNVTAISQMTHQTTTILSNCTKCNKALSRPQGCWWCDRCRKTPNLCVICQQIVKGLFAWCQGCSHGGHYRCVRRWYVKNTLCPTGCGHHCEYQ